MELPRDSGHRHADSPVSADPRAPERTLRSVAGGRAAEVPEEATMIGGTNAALSLVGGKWKVDILYLLAAGIRRRRTMHEHVPIAKRVLTDVLRSLERDGLVSRRVIEGPPTRVEYALTPLGRSITCPLFALFEWAEEHMGHVQAARAAHSARLGTTDDAVSPSAKPRPEAA